MLVTKSNAIAGLADAVGFGALPAYWLLLIALELPLTASQTDLIVLVGHIDAGEVEELTSQYGTSSSRFETGRRA